MTHSIAWSDLNIGVTEQTRRSFLLRKFQLLSDTLEDRLYEGAVALELSNAYSNTEYNQMALQRVLQHASTSQATVIIQSDDDLAALTPFMPVIVGGFQDLLSE